VKSKTPIIFAHLHVIINILLFVLICWQIFFGSFFRIKTIYIKGSEELINNQDLLKTNENLITLSTKNYIKKIKQNYPYIKSAIVYKKFPSSIVIETINRNPIFYTAYEDSIAFIDEEGKVLPNLKIWQNTLKIKLNCEIQIDKNNETVANLDLTKQFITINNMISQTDLRPTEFICTDKNVYKIIIENIEIVFLSDIDENNLISSLQVLFKQFRIEGKQPVRIDLRFSKPVVQYESENLNSAFPSGNL